MSYINCGAVTAGGALFPTKAELRRWLADKPTRVVFLGTTPLGETLPGGSCTGTTVPEGVKLLVVGPDPQRSRKWYATVENKAGKVTCK
jgi:hypothetical protein